MNAFTEVNEVEQILYKNPGDIQFRIDGRLWLDSSYALHA
jgi:hypothetical protein